MPHGDDYLEPYRQAVDLFGATFDATLWNSPEAQRLRFDVFIGMCDLAGRSIVDAGCGLADFASRLVERGVKYERYIGVDGVPQVLRKAMERGLERAEFVEGDFISDHSLFARHRPDVVLFSGSLNTIPQKQARQAVGRAWEAATVGVLFNFLSDRCGPRWAEKDTGVSTRFDTLDWLDWALRTTPNVRFRQDYLQGHDATIALLK